MLDILVFFICFIISLFTFYNLLPKKNPYNFPKLNRIDKYVYIDDLGVCYEYKRKYI